MTPLWLWLAVAWAHTPQAGLVEVVLDDDGAGALRWRAPDTGPAAGLVVAVPDGCSGGPPRARRGEGFVETSVDLRCEGTSGPARIDGLAPGGQVVASVRGPGGTARRRLGGGEALDLGLRTATPPSPVRSAPLLGCGLLVAAAGLLRVARVAPVAHVLGVVGAFLLLRALSSS